MGASGGTLQTKRSVVIHFSYLDDGFIIEIDDRSASQSMCVITVYTIHINELFIQYTVPLGRIASFVYPCMFVQYKTKHYGRKYFL